MSGSSKLILPEERVAVPIPEAHQVGVSLLRVAGCPADTAEAIIDHLIDADLCGVESHGIVRALQYHDEYKSGYIRTDAIPEVCPSGGSTLSVDGKGGLGIPAMLTATEAGIKAARAHGIAAVGVRNTGHTGRLGAFAEMAAAAGCLFIACGGGARERWRMVTPYGGRKAVLPTNPWCLGIPGGAQGPVILDCATGQLAGGWIYAARRAGAQLPVGALVDRDGRPTQRPEDYFAGGAIVPKGGVLGFGLATMGELICDAMLGPASVECNTFLLIVDTSRYREASALQNAAEAILNELRNCPPAEGFERVEVPGERETSRRAASAQLNLPVPIWQALCAGPGAEQPGGRSGRRPGQITGSESR